MAWKLLQRGAMAYGRSLTVLAITAVAFSFEETAIVPAIPHIEKALHGSKSSATLLQSAFRIVASIAAPLIGKLGDRFGKPRLMIITLGIYFVAAIGAALSPRFWPLVLSRGAQGAGGAIFGLAFAIMRDAAGEEKLGTVIGVIVGGFGVGMASAFSLSGLLIASFGWHSLFWEGAIFSLVAAFLVRFGVPPSTDRHGTRTDVLGAVLLGCAPSAIVIGLISRRAPAGLRGPSSGC